jgi:predicted ATP-dependent serine protease
LLGANPRSGGQFHATFEVSSDGGTELAVTVVDRISDELFSQMKRQKVAEPLLKTGDVMTSSPEVNPVRGLKKARTGIDGFDEITGGGLPQGRPTLVCGGPGSGKTLFGMEFLVRGARQFDEPGVFMSFEEKDADLVENFSSLGFDLDDLLATQKLALDYVHIERRKSLKRESLTWRASL